MGEAGAHVGANGLGVPGPNEAVGAAQQLRGQPPQALPTHQHHRQRPRAHRRVQRQLHPGRGRLGRGAKVGGACKMQKRHDITR